VSPLVRRMGRIVDDHAFGLGRPPAFLPFPVGRSFVVHTWLLSYLNLLIRGVTTLFLPQHARKGSGTGDRQVSEREGCVFAGRALLDCLFRVYRGWRVSAGPPERGPVDLLL